MANSTGLSKHSFFLFYTYEHVDFLILIILNIDNIFIVKINK